MRNRLYLILVAVIAVIGFSGCASMNNKATAESALDAKLKKLEVPAVIAVTPGLDFTALKMDGVVAKRCSIPEKGKQPEYEICPAFKEGAKILDKQTITVIKSKGSICYTYYDRNNHAHMICIP